MNGSPGNIPDWFDEGDDGDIPKILPFYEDREPPEQDDGRPDGRQRPQAVHRLGNYGGADNGEVEHVFR